MTSEFMPGRGAAGGRANVLINIDILRWMLILEVKIISMFIKSTTHTSFPPALLELCEKRYESSMTVITSSFLIELLFYLCVCDVACDEG